MVSTDTTNTSKSNTMTDKKVEGYWYSEYEPQYPKPVPNVLTQTQARRIYELILAKEHNARVIYFKGLSHSRITNESLGNREYMSDGWYWPGDFAKHYVLDHRVRPTDAFLEFIGYSEPLTLKSIIR